MADIDVDTHGPIFIPGYPELVMDRATHEVEEKIAERGAEMIRNALDGVLRHQTGYYRSHVRAHGDEINDGGVVYGPWLEGVGSRNRTTRFKGYWTFRRTTGRIESETEHIAQNVVDRHTRRLE